MSLYLKDYVGIALSGASFAIMTSALSTISGEVFNVPLGYNSFSIKNVAKVGFLGAGTFVAIFAVADRIKPLKDRMREELFPETIKDNKFRELFPAEDHGVNSF